MAGMDRNQAAREKFAAAQRSRELAKARQEFAAAAAAGQAAVYDKFGKRVEAGQLVHFIAPATGVVAEVVGVGPVMDPNAPVGLIKIELVISQPLTYQAGVQARDLIVVGRQATPEQQMALETPGAEEPATEEPEPIDDPTAEARESEAEAIAGELDRPLPPPESMHGAGDQFPGEDFPHSGTIELTDKD